MSSLLRALSALAALLAGLLASRGQVQFNEIMYHPVEEPAFNADGTPALDLSDDVFEFIELYNSGRGAVSLAGWELSGGINFVFGPDVSIQPGEFLVVAKDPARLLSIKEYALSPTAVVGPWTGNLGNEGETIRLRDASGKVVESVAYSSQFPWAIGANAHGAGANWTGLNPMDYQYRGRSLERVSLEASANDSANWLASPLSGNPSPGGPNAVSRSVPKPVVIQLRASQASTGHYLIRRNESARIECLFSSTAGLSGVSLEYFVDDINLTNEPPKVVPMLEVGNAALGQFQADLPGQPDRSVVRYRIRANRGEGDEIVSPRADDPFGWHAYFVTPLRASANPIYDLFISSASITRLGRNLADNPNSGYRPRTNTVPNGRWNLTEPAVFVHDGFVYDVQARYNGSFFRRSPGRQSYKVEFPRFARFQGQPTLLLTDKDSVTVAAHTIFRAAGLPTSHTRWVDLYVNRGTRLTRLEIEEHDELLLERYHRAQAFLRGETTPEAAGRIFKSSGILDNTVPYGRGDGSRLGPVSGFTELKRYEWVYSLKNDDWRGYFEFKDMINGLATARGVNAAQNVPALRKYFSERWDTNDVLTYLSVRNWMSTWDDTVHNFFLWQKHDGRWSMLPWDFDSDMGGTGEASPAVNIFRGENNSGANTHGNHTLKDSLFKALRQEYKERLFFLNNTVLHPENIRALGITSGTIPGFSRSRLTNVNRQLNLGVFHRPSKPTNSFPASAQTVSPATTLRASDYGYSTNPPAPHASTTWFIRHSRGDYTEPVFQLTSSNQLASLPVPGHLLKLGETYFWKCLFTDTNGHPSLASQETSFTIGAAREANDFVLNELMANNRSTLANAGKFPDWVELHNASDQARSLAGYSLTDDLLVPDKFRFPAGTSVPARGYLIIWCDDATKAPGLHTGFGLSADGQTLGLFADSADGWLLKDVVQFGPQLADHSIGRVLNGSGTWTLNVPTPHKPNGSQRLGSPDNLKINEWLANPESGDDWFEVFNPDPLPVSLAELSFTDDARNFAKSPSPPLSFIAGRGFLKLEARGASAQGGNQAGFRLAAAGGLIGLFRVNGTPVDYVFYPPQQTGVSQGRVPDGGPNIYTLERKGTPEKTNFIDSNGDNLPDAWEVSHGFDPFARSSAHLDADGDGLSNFDEFLAGTNPRSADNKLRIDALDVGSTEAGVISIRFIAEPGKTYTVQYRDEVGENSWQNLRNVSNGAARQIIELPDSAAPATGARYYRLVTPSLGQ